MPLSTFPTHVLALHPRRVVAPLATTGLVDHPDGAQRIRREVRQDRPQMRLEGVTGRGVLPVGSDGKLLKGSHGGSGGQGDGLDTLTRQVGQQPPAVRIEVARRPVRADCANSSMSTKCPKPPTTTVRYQVDDT